MNKKILHKQAIANGGFIPSTYAISSKVSTPFS